MTWQCLICDNKAGVDMSDASWMPHLRGKDHWKQTKLKRSELKSNDPSVCPPHCCRLPPCTNRVDLYVYGFHAAAEF